MGRAPFQALSGMQGAAAAAASAGGGRCVTVCSTMNYLRPALGPEIRCTALPQRVGRRVAVYETRLTDARGELVATGVFTFHIEHMDPAEG